jgi:tRNA G10  N-methylase Trm11
MDGVDFRDLPHGDNEFDAVAYDPPYVCIGGRGTTGMSEMYGRYGQMDAPTSPGALQLLMNTGLSEMQRVCKPKGFVLVKCQDYVSSGKLWLGTHHTLSYGLKVGFEIVDRLEMVTSPRPQPPGRRQVHARRNLSTLIVMRKR